MLPLSRKLILGFVMLLFLGTLLLFLPKVDAEGSSSSLDVQLIADQDALGVGGTGSYHIIYHNVSNEKITNAWIKIKVPTGLEVENTAEANWDATTRVLKWNIKDLQMNGASVIHFNVKVKADVALDTLFELTCIVEVDGEASFETPKIKLRTGTEIHQPFFIGFPDGNFYPESYLTRAEAAAIVARIKNLEDDSALTEGYADVPQTHWAYSYITKVTNAGYMTGYNGEFRPDEPISRAELITLVLRLRGIHAVPLVSFEDSFIHWAKDSIGTAKALKFIEGIDELHFNPNGYTERQAAAKLFNVAFLRGPLVDGEVKVEQHFPDVSPEHWSYGWIEEASVVAHESEHRGNGLEYLIRYLPDETEPF